MISQVKKKDFNDILTFLKARRDSDFYYTSNNQRIFIETEKQLKDFLKVSSMALRSYGATGDIDGLALIWKSTGETPRFYLKISSTTPDIAKRLLKVLTWNFGKELFAKMNKKNKLLPALMGIGFKFFGDRGREILVKRDRVEIKEQFIKED